MFITPRDFLRSGLFLFFFCLLSSLTAADYFWIGGSGNWSDISHWATTSGGVTTHSQAPGSDDDVFFDANSFTAPGQTVTLNTDIIFCRNMSWTGVTNTPTFTGLASVTINVFGSWNLDAGMTYEFYGTTLFSGGLANDVDYATYSAGRSVIFSGTGSWALQSTLSCDSTLTLAEGTLTTGGQDVVCGFLRSEGTATRTLDLGNTELIVTRSTIVPFEQADDNIRYHSIRLEATNLTIVPGSSTIDLRGNQVDILLEGPGNLDFNRVLLSAPMGRSRVIPWTRDNGFGTEPTVSYGELDLFHQTTLGGSPTIGSLILHPGQRYLFESGQTFTLDQLTATGDCTSGIDLTATQAATPANFASDDPITADFVSIRSIAAAGGGTFTATNAVDLGGNAGWTFTEKPSDNFYWIGGTGNWDDPVHWSTTSGGLSSGCVPSVTDDVFFDANSFTGAGQTVTVNVENAACRNMSWAGATGNPNFSGPADHRMRIAGSLIFQAAMNHDFAGDYFFASTAVDNVIISAGQRFNHNLTFDGGGAWRLSDALYVHEAIDLEAGTLRTNDQDVNTNFLRSRSAQLRGLFLGNSHITLESRNMEFFYTELLLVSSNLTFDAGTSIIEFTGGFSGNTFLDGDQALTFNVVIFSSALGQWSHNLYNGVPLSSTIDSLVYQNSGSLGGDNTINYCYLRPGRTYEWFQGGTQTITELDANGTCEEGQITLQSSSPEELALLALPPGQTFDQLLLRNIEVTTGAPATATNSIDAGGNGGWNITGGGSRTLYWVDGNGDWFDEAHWATTSGGTGGNCIPTAIDDVIFDGNSAIGPDLTIVNASDRSATCRDVSWLADLTVRTSFQVRTFRVYGDFNNAAPQLQYQSSPTYLNGPDADHVIISNGAFLNQLVFTQVGTYTIQDDLLAWELNYQTGDVVFANQNVELNRIVTVRSQTQKNLDLGNTHIVLNGETFGFSEALSIYTGSNLVISPGNSLIEFTHPNARLRADYEVSLNNVLFSNPAANVNVRSDNEMVDVLTTNAMVFNGSGQIDLELTTDTLICSPGKSYVFAADKTQRVNDYWQIIGNNCTPISLASSTPGQAATASVPATGEILANFIQMRDITGVGGATFLAGARSTDINNSNQNWVFETAPEFQEVGFLGEDRALCAGEDLTLDAYNFSPGETYLWHDGSSDSTFTTNQSGTYFVQVTFQTSCVIRDTIEVLDAQAFSVDLPDNPVICAGGALTLDADAGINSADYRWQDGSEETFFEASEPGEYFVVVNLGGCVETDTTTLTVTPLPTVDLGQDQVACAGEDFTLTADVVAESFRWQDGSGDGMFVGNAPGTYWVEAINGACPIRDSVEVTYVDAGSVDLGPDTIVCVADDLLLDAGVPDFNYTWQDGSGGQTFLAATTGTFFVEIENSGCTAADTISVTFPELPMLDVAANYEACENTTLRITAAVPADSYRWSNGQSGPDFSTLAPGPYLVTATFGPCEVSQDFDVAFLTPPTVDLGPDIMECTGTPVTLMAPQSGTWQDGTMAMSYLVTSPGSYRVEVFNGDCGTADSVTVGFLPLPDFSLGEDQTACDDEILTVTVPTGVGTITWDDGLMDTQRDFLNPGIRWVDITDANGCVGRDSVALFFNAFPSLELGPDTTVCDDTPFALSPTVSGGILSWPDGTEEATFPVSGPAPARIVAALSENGCTTTDTVTVSFRECIDFKAYLPTAFSPNFDGVNDDFTVLFDPRVEVRSLRTQVFSRWGDQLFLSEDPAARWDGTARGKPLPVGPYLYIIEITYQDDRGVGSEVIKGDVMLVR